MGAAVIRFRLDVATRDEIGCVARAEVRRLRRPLSLADAQKAVADWAYAQKEQGFRSWPSWSQRQKAARIAADEGTDYAKRCVRAGAWL